MEKESDQKRKQLEKRKIKKEEVNHVAVKRSLYLNRGRF